MVTEVVDTWIIDHGMHKERKSNMIRAREDYLRYLEADRIALGRKHKYGFMDWLMDDIWTFERLLRKVEYYHNCVKSTWGKVKRRILYYKLHRMKIRMSLSIPINVFDEGLSISHYGPIVINDKAKIGKNCRIHVGVNIGEGGPDAKAPQIGDNCYLGPGAKLFGGIVLGDNVKVGANAVVNKSFPGGNCTLVGVPAHKVE